MDSSLAIYYGKTHHIVNKGLTDITFEIILFYKFSVIAKDRKQTVTICNDHCPDNNTTVHIHSHPLGLEPVPGVHRHPTNSPFPQ